MDHCPWLSTSKRSEPNICPADQTNPEDGEGEIKVKLIIGTLPEQSTLTISKSLLVDDAGGFFAACFRHGMQETEANEIKFPEEPVVPFERLIGYIRKRPGPHSFLLCDAGAVLQCLECYVLAEKYSLHKTQDAIVDGLSGLWYSKMEKQHFAWILDNIEPTSPLYKLAIDRMALNIARRPLEYLAHDHADNGGYPYSTQEYIEQIEILFGASIGTKLFMTALQICDWEPAIVNCRYHVHAAEEDCVGKKPGGDLWSMG